MYNGQKEKYIASVFTFGTNGSAPSTITIGPGLIRFLGGIGGTGFGTDLIKVAMPRKGTLKNLWYRATGTFTPATTTTPTFIVFKNGAATPLLATWDNTAKKGNSSGLFVDVDAGDFISVQVNTMGGTGTGMVRLTISFELEVDDDYPNPLDYNPASKIVSYSDGDVQVGTDALGTPHNLTVDGTIYANGSIEFPDGTSLNTAPSGGGGGSSVISESGGNVGIGTVAPQEKLTLAPDSDTVVEMGTPTGVTAVAQPGGYLGTGTYFFRIVALDGAGGTTPALPETSCLINNPPNGRCHLSWSPVAGAAAYRVYRIDHVTGQYHYFVTPDTFFDYDTDTGATLDPSGVPSVTTAFLNRIAASGPSWLSGGNVGIGISNPQEKLCLAPDSNVVVEMTTPTGVAITPQSGGSLTPSLDFYIRVVAEDGAGGLTTGSLPEMRYRPAGGNNSCVITWNAVHGAKNYRVYIGNTAGMQNRYFISPTNNFSYVTDAGVITTDAVTHLPSTVPNVTNAYVNKLSASGNSWLLGGNLGIGVSNPVVPLQIKPGVIYLDGSPGARVYYINNGTSEWCLGTQTGMPGQDFNLYNYNTKSIGFSVNLATNAMIVPQGVSTSSSKRWKKNIQTIKGALSKVKRLRGISYDQKEGDKHTIGLVAEEVGEVIPEIVTYEENGTDAQGLDYSRLVAVLIEAVKEQQGQIEELKDTVKSFLADKSKAAGLA